MKPTKPPILCIDFDGTCVKHVYDPVSPSVIGEDIGAVPYLKQLSDNGVKIICYTIRTGEHAESAKDWFKRNDIKLWAVNRNPDQEKWNKSTKPLADLYVDDRGFNMPLMADATGPTYVNWKYVGPCLLRWAGIQG